MRPLAITAVCLAWSAQAYAAPSETEKAAAKALFEQGRAFAKAGQWAEACPKLAESQRLDPGIGTLYNLADCHEHIGKVATAWIEFGEVADIAKGTVQPEREKIARSRAQALSARVPRVELKKNGPLPDKSDIVLDGKSVGIAVVDTPIPIDPGEHRLAIVTPERTAERTFIVLTGAGTTSIELPPFEVPAAVAPAAETPTGAPRPTSSSSTSTWHRPVAIGLGAAGVAALGVAAFFGFRANSQWREVEKDCPNDRCTPRGYGGWEDAQSSATVGTIVFAAGAALVATAIVVWVLQPSSLRSAAR